MTTPSLKSIPLVTKTLLKTWVFKSFHLVYVKNQRSRLEPCEILCSDGSLKHVSGAFGAVCITNQDKDEKMRQFRGKLRENPGPMSSYRAEAGSIAEMLTNHILKTILCDIEAIIKNTNNYQAFYPLSAEWDYVEYARKIVQKHHIKCNHVQGHQYRKKEKKSKQRRKMEF